MNLANRNLRYHWRTHLAVVLGVAAASAALAGALLVGDSMRGSLREAALLRLGGVDEAITADRFFRAALADDLCGRGRTVDCGLSAPPAPADAAAFIRASGGVTHAGTQARVEHVQVLGVDDGFRRVAGLQPPPARDSVDASRSVVINAALATELRAATGDEIILRIGKPAAISTETLLGRRDDVTRALRLTVAAILPDAGPASFSISPRQQAPFNVFVPLPLLQRTLEQPDRANAIALSVARRYPTAPAADTAATLRRFAMLADYGLRLRTDAERGYVSLESERQLIEPAIERAAIVAAARQQAKATPLLAYLANDIRSHGGAGRPVPYSTVVGVAPETPPALLRLPSGDPAPPLAAGDILLNEWAAGTLGVQPGATVALEYYVSGPGGELETRTAAFTLRGVVAPTPAAHDAGFVPEYPGVTDARRMSDWDPPFPVDFRRVTPADEQYWEAHRTTPKAFVSLADAQRLWAEDGARFGRLTAVRFQPTDGRPLDDFARALDTALRAPLDPTALGFTMLPLRVQALAAAAGNTDFGGLFIGFSFFLIASAALLVALLFRLGVERRAKEIGLLAALGFSRRRLLWLLLAEGALIAVVGTLLGLLLAPLYASLMLAGLRSWWSGAVNAPFLRLHVAPGTLETSAIVSVAIALASIAWAVRGVLRVAPRTLLAGGGSSERFPSRPPRPIALAIGVASSVAAAALLLAARAEALPAVAGFFGSGTLLLIAALALLRHILRPRTTTAGIQTPGPAAWFRLGLRNAARNPARSLLTAGLIASASFLITALGAFRLETDPDPRDRTSGTGGFPLYAEAAVPLPYDLNTPTGRDALGIGAEAERTLGTCEFVPFRLRPGDASSCLNLYSGTRRRILGATDRFVARGGFAFSASLAATPPERSNPWLLLHQKFDDGAIPAIGDEAAVKWQLHRGLGRDLPIEDAYGRPATLRFVALLSNSALQDELIVAEAGFLRLFPRTEGYAFFLIDTPPGGPDFSVVENALERALTPFAFDAASTTGRVAAYNRVQNTYLATFQTLGGFGLILGVVGLAAVLLRNVWERRAELALLTAVGFARRAVGSIVLAENAALLLAGLLAGVLPALVAIAPQIATRPAVVPWATLATTLSAVLAVGLLAGLLALRPALRAPPLPALRSE